MKKAHTIPKTIGACADLLFKLREQKSALNRQADALSEHEKAIKDHLIATLPKDKADGVIGKLAKVAIVLKQEPSVKDWDLFYKHVLKTKDFSLMSRQLSKPSIKERWDNGKKVPGVEPFTVVTVSVTKK